MTYGELWFDEVSGRFFSGEFRIPLTKMEFVILKYLYDRSGKVVTREALSEHMYGWMPSCDAPANIDGVTKVHLHKLRNKLSSSGVTSHHINTVWGHGLSLEPLSVEEPINRLISGFVIIDDTGVVRTPPKISQSAAWTHVLKSSGVSPIDREQLSKESNLLYSRGYRSAMVSVSVDRICKRPD